MCGIAGIVGPGAGQQSGLIQSMGTLLRHRGPDDSGLWSDPKVVFVHRRLSILDLSTAGHQPMSWKDERYWIIFNGEIYNYLELRQELEAKGVRFRSRTDTEVLLAAYQVWGEGCLPKLNGMWAFAIWDKVEERLFASRDRFGKKPFYYVNFQNRLYFASEIKALLLIPGLKRTLHLPALADFLAERTTDHTEETLIREIRQLPPASILRWWKDIPKIESYWTFPDHVEECSRSAILDDVGQLLEDSVRLRLRADTPVGCLASGGLDSSAVACLMRAESKGPGPIHLFTTRVHPPVEEASGLPLITQRGGYEMHEDTPTAQTFWEDLPKVLWHQEEPFADGSMVAHFRLMRAARQAGVPVLLTGQGADEVFAGYQGFLSMFQGQLLRRGNPFVLAQGGDFLGTLFHALPATWRNRYRTWSQNRALQWLRPEIRQSLGQIPRYEDIPRGLDPLNAILRDSMTRWTLPAFLRYEDRNSMAFGVETRLPYLDYRLVERLFHVSGKEKLEGGRMKGLLRDMAARWVPEPIVSRKSKQAYPAPVAQWLRELKPQVKEIVLSRSVEESPFLDAAHWRKEAERFWGYDEVPMESLWRGLMAHLWYENIFKRDFSKDL